MAKEPFEDNDYLWDSTNNQLIKYKSEETAVKGSISFYSTTNSASAIALNEDVLEAIGFKANGNAEYVSDNYVIKIDGSNPDCILQIDGTPVRFVSDVQQFYRAKGHELNIDETKLIKACMKGKQP